MIRHCPKQKVGRSNFKRRGSDSSLRSDTSGKSSGKGSDRSSRKVAALSGRSERHVQHDCGRIQRFRKTPHASNNSSVSSTVGARSDTPRRHKVKVSEVVADDVLNEDGEYSESGTGVPQKQRVRREH